MNQGLLEVSHCEVCSNTRLTSVLNLGHHPMCDDLVAVDDSRACHEYPIDILFCPKCITAHQRFQVPKSELFPATYHYRSRFTADVLNGMQNLVAECEKQFGSLSGKKVVDIGCNDGSLLNIFSEKNSTTIGIEPTDAADDAKQANHIVYKGYFSEALAQQVVQEHGCPDFITFTNVFAHIEDLSSVLRALKILMSEQTVLVIENHYLGSVLDGNQFDTFYHEHPRTYSYASFTRMACTLGSDILGVEFPSRYGGNIRVFIGSSHLKVNVDEEKLDQLSDRESRYGLAFGLMNENIERWKHNKAQEIKKLVNEHGPLRAKAFPGRAAILVKLLGLDESMISAVYEKPGSMKIGHYLPGTRIPIHSDDELFALSNQALPILNLAWHIPEEISSYMHAHDYVGEIIGILSVQDFNDYSGLSSKSARINELSELTKA
ncbi:MAG: class I SAM-dependent methyltransferase [Legionellaceae bacterium]|nr:class I SAM-dependent methyltransferase [Legionellaceae bacterium]